MQSRVSAGQISANAATTLSLDPPLDAPLTERQIAELHEVWLEHQVNPPREKSGVPYSALND